MAFSTNKDVKNKQFVIFSLVALIIIGVIYMILFNDPAIKQQFNKAAERKQTYDIPGADTNYVQQWITKSETDIENLKQDMRAFKGEIKNLVMLLRADFSKVQDTIDNYSGERKRLWEQVDSLKTRVDQSGFITQKEFKQFVKKQQMSSPVQMTKQTSRPQINPEANQKTETGYPPAEAFPDFPSFAQKNNNMNHHPPSASGTDLTELGKLSSFAGSNKIIKVTLNTAAQKKRPHIKDHIPATTVIKTVLLNGVHAPTGEIAKERPVPMFFQVLNNGSLPNKFRHKVEECRFLGSGFGDVSTSRVVVRLIKFVCVLKNGEFISVDAKGVVADENGIGDIEGKLFDRTGDLIGNSMLAGGASGFGQALSQTYSTLATTPTGTVSSVNPSQIGEYSLASGIGTSFAKIADYYLKRAAELYPVVEVLPGRIIDIELTEDIDLGANLWEEKS